MEKVTSMILKKVCNKAVVLKKESVSIAVLSLIIFLPSIVIGGIFLYVRSLSFEALSEILIAVQKNTSMNIKSELDLLNFFVDNYFQVIFLFLSMLIVVLFSAPEVVEDRIGNRLEIFLSLIGKKQYFQLIALSNFIFSLVIFIISFLLFLFTATAVLPVFEVSIRTVAHLGFIPLVILAYSFFCTRISMISENSREAYQKALIPIFIGTVIFQGSYIFNFRLFTNHSTLWIALNLWAITYILYYNSTFERSLEKSLSKK